MSTQKIFERWELEIQTCLLCRRSHTYELILEKEITGDVSLGMQRFFGRTEQVRLYRIPDSFPCPVKNQHFGYLVEIMCPISANILSIHVQRILATGTTLSIDSDEDEALTDLTNLLEIPLSQFSRFESDRSGYYIENKHIIRLGLQSCRLKSLPDSIGNFMNLTWLNLAKNELTSLPESIGNLRKIDYLIAYDNCLTTLPETIMDLTNLRFLNLNGNNLDSHSNELIDWLDELKQKKILY